VGLTMQSMSWEYRNLGRYSEFLVAQEAVVAFKRRVLRPDDYQVIYSVGVLAVAYDTVGRHDEALQLHLKSLEDMRRILPKDNPDLILSLRNLGGCYTCLQRYHEALDVGQKVLEFRRRVLPPFHLDVGRSIVGVASSYVDLEMYKEAAQQYEEALLLFQRTLPSEHPDITQILKTLPLIYRKLGKHDEASNVGLTCQRNYACGNCKVPLIEEDIMTCGGCGAEHYCDEECQVAHWKVHKPACKEAQKRKKTDVPPVGDVTGPKNASAPKKKAHVLKKPANADEMGKPMQAAAAAVQPSDGCSSSSSSATTKPFGEAQPQIISTQAAAICGHCSMIAGEGVSNLMKCTGCRQTHYCSKKCQAADWKRHKKACKEIHGTA
jgi:tetratricopeptide (TPR) repeat protein